MIDTALLSRAQFGFTIAFHILFPTLNIGLGLFITLMEAQWLRTGQPIYLRICKFWTKVFALTFGMGVVSGIVMSYELGTNFAEYTKSVGPVLGAFFSYEVLSAFFLEAGFLGIMLFGWERVGKRLHFLATLFVTVGTTVSAFWILAANSWMQTPAGAELIDGVFHVTNWWDAALNPSMLHSFIHMLLASYLACCFFVIGICSWYVIKNEHAEFARKCLSFAFAAALILVPLQVFIGDKVGLTIHKYQPLKTAAIEGVWETQRGAPLLLFAWPNVEKEKNDLAIKIPYGASLINTHQLDGVLIGLKSVAKEDRPVVVPVFYAFRIMVGIGLLMFVLAIIGNLKRRHDKLYQRSFFHYLLVLATPLGFVATLAGWITTEMGRQPWIVYEKLRTIAAASPIPLHQVIVSLVLFVFVYNLLLGFYLYYLSKVIRKGPYFAKEEHLPFAYMEIGEKKE